MLRLSRSTRTKTSATTAANNVEFPPSALAEKPLLALCSAMCRGWLTASIQSLNVSSGQKGQQSMQCSLSGSSERSRPHTLKIDCQSRRQASRSEETEPVGGEEDSHGNKDFRHQSFRCRFRNCPPGQTAPTKSLSFSISLWFDYIIGSFFSSRKQK